MKQWPLHKAHFWETTPFIRLLLPLIAGIVVYPIADKLLNYSGVLGITSFILSAAVYTTLSFARQNKPIVKYTGFVFMHLSLILASWLLRYYQDIRNDRFWFGHNISNADGYVATITEVPAEKERSWKLEVNVTHTIHGNKTVPVTGKAFVYVYKFNAPALHEGDIIIIPNKWQPITNSGNPFEFDYATYLSRNNIYYRQFISGDELTIHSYTNEHDLNWIRRIHHWSARQLEWYITDRQTLGLLKAILLGDKEELDNNLTEVYAGTGIVHIMAISGAHIAIFFLLAVLLLSWMKHKKYYWVKYIAALPLIWLYVVVAGAPTSAVRAAIMFSLLGIGFALQKYRNGVNQLLATAFVVLCINPYWLYDVGFQLSFTAVLSIFLFYKHAYRWYSPANKALRTIWAAIAVSISAEILVAPLVIYYFHLFPLQFIVANVLAYLFMSVTLIGGMLLIVISLFYPVAHFIASLLTVITTWFNHAIYLLQQINFDSFHRLTLSTSQIILVYLTIAGIAVYFIKKQTKALLLSLTLCSLFLLSSCMVEWQSLKQNIFVVYNTSKAAQIELITGTTCTTLVSPEIADPATEEYVLRPAHINMHIRDTMKAKNSYNFINTNGEIIFILNQPIQDTTIQADYVVITGTKGINMADIKQVFGDAQIIFSTAVSRNKAEVWTRDANTSGLSVHNIRSEGAFVLSDHLLLQPTK
ncbi:MAG: ComEC family competence protein [Chitinophagales bacterium]|nr:ComEC family competence protein [Chitinophagales bacterium]